MSSYFIFVLVLTVAYVIYYATIIALDLRKKPEDSKTVGEVIDVSDYEEEASVAVSESEGGFSIGDNDYKTTIAPVSVEEVKRDDEEKKQRIRTKMKNLLESLEETPKTFGHQMYTFDLYKEMAKKQSSNIKNEVQLNFVPIQKKDPNEKTI